MWLKVHAHDLNPDINLNTCFPRSLKVVVQLLSRVWLCDPMDRSMPGSSVLQYLPEFAQTHVHWVGNAIQSSHPLPRLSPLPSIFASIRIFSSEAALCIRSPKYYSFSISPSNQYSRLISFRIDWFDLLAFRIDWFDLLVVQGTLKSLLQHHISKASILWCSAFFVVQLSHPYMTTRKIRVLTICILVGKVLSLLFNMFSRFVIAFLPRSKHLLISWLLSLCTVILEPKKTKFVTASTFSPSICHEVLEPDAITLVFFMLSLGSVFALFFHPHQENL